MFHIARKYRFEIAIVAIGLAAIHGILLFPAFHESDSITASGSGLFGDFVGGYIGTMVALLSVLLFYRALGLQREGSAQEHFEARFFEMVKMHRDNVSALALGRDDAGSKIFVLLVREFREAWKVVEQVAASRSLRPTRSDLLLISYNVLLYGVGPNSTRMLRNSLKKFDSEFARDLEASLENPETRKSVKSSRHFRFKPFGGHLSRLGHYYRHLFQAVDYAHKHAPAGTSYGYVKLLRAQLTTHEQAMLLLNSLTPIGQRWWFDNYIQQYKLVKNIPDGFFDPNVELDVEALFGPEYFEWQKSAKGLSTGTG